MGSHGLVPAGYAVDQELTNKDVIVKEACEKIKATKERMNWIYYFKHREEFAVGDVVYFKLQPYIQLSVAVRSIIMSSARYVGTFKILQMVGPMAFKLDLPVDAPRGVCSREHGVFQVAALYTTLCGS